MPRLPSLEVSMRTPQLAALYSLLLINENVPHLYKGYKSGGFLFCFGKRHSVRAQALADSQMISERK